MAREGSPLTEVTSADKYTAPPTVHVIRGKDQDGRELIVWVYTTVIRYAYADLLISEEEAREIAREAAGRPVRRPQEGSLPSDSPFRNQL